MPAPGADMSCVLVIDDDTDIRGLVDVDAFELVPLEVA